MAEALNKIMVQRPSMDFSSVHDILYADIDLNGAMALSRKSCFV